MWSRLGGIAIALQLGAAQAVWAMPLDPAMPIIVFLDVKTVAATATLHADDATE
jgi:hypothetical protein